MISDKELEKMIKHFQQVMLFDDEFILSWLGSELQSNSEELLSWAYEDFGVDKEEFRVSLKIYLTLKAKPWCKKEDLVIWQEYNKKHTDK